MDPFELSKTCKHTITDEDQGMIFCIECGLVTEEYVFHQGGGSYGKWRSILPKKKKSRKKKASNY